MFAVSGLPVPDVSLPPSCRGTGGFSMSRASALHTGSDSVVPESNGLYSCIFYLWFAGRMLGRNVAMMPNRGRSVLVLKMNSMLVRSASQPKNAEPMRPDRTSARRRGLKSCDFVRFQVGGVHQYGREGRSDDQTYDDGHGDGPVQVEVWQCERERSRARMEKSMTYFRP